MSNIIDINASINPNRDSVTVLYRFDYPIASKPTLIKLEFDYANTKWSLVQDMNNKERELLSGTGSISTEIPYKRMFNRHDRLILKVESFPMDFDVMNNYSCTGMIMLNDSL